MSTKNASKPVEPEIVRQLRAIRPGQVVVYYTGNLAADIAACKPVDKDQGAPGYGQMLVAIQEAAKDLVGQGKLRLSERKALRRGWDEAQISVTEYVATGTDLNSLDTAKPRRK